MPHRTLGTTSGQATARRAARIASVAALGGLIFGYDVSVTNGAVGALEAEFRAGSFLLGAAAAGALVGAAAGAIFAGRIADRLGRLAMMKLAAALFFVSAFGVGLAGSIWGVIIFHVVGGVGIGVASAIVPAYIAEISPPHVRGRLGALQQLAIVLGIFLALAVDWLPFHLAGGPRGELWLGLSAWRWTFLTEAIPALLYGALAFTIPESPRHLIAVQQVPEARRVLALLLGDRDVDVTVARISETLSRQHPPSFRELRTPTGGLFRIVWVGIGLAVFQQLCGINVIFYYGDTLWQAVGFGAGSSYLIAVITSVVNVVMTLVAIALIDKVGRRPLLLTGSAVMASMLAAMATVFAAAPISNGKPKLDGALGPIALIAANVFVIAFAVSWGPIVWVLLGEIFPNRLRAGGVGLAAAAQWLANFAIGFTFPAVRHMLGFAYGCYALAAALSFVFVWRWVRETKGVHLEDLRP